MPVETRTLVFDAAELVAAAYEYCIVSGVPIPTTRVLAVTVGTEDSASCTMRFEAGSTGPQRSVILTYSQIASALILFCRKRKIPLPRDADKRLSPAGDGMALMLRRTPKPRLT